MLNAVLFLATVLIWGTTGIAITMQMGPVPVLVSVFYRFALAGVLLLALLVVSGRLKLPEWRHQPFILAQALCLFCCNFICFYTAAAYVPSGVESVIFSLATLYNAVNARLFYKEPIARRTLVAAVVGFAGICLLFSHDLAEASNLDSLKGAGLCLLGTLFFSLGNMVSRRNSAAGIPPALANGWGMTYGALILLVLVGLTGAPLTPPPDSRYLGALLYLAVVGSIIGFTVYLLLVARIGSSKAAYCTVLFPVIALALSSVYEGYQWTLAGGLGLALCLAGNLVMFAKKRVAA